ncbi:hypothetical protein ACRAWD_24000 [Caulobacter segnis]
MLLSSVDLAVLVAIGLLMEASWAFGSDRIPAPYRYAYWMSCMVGGGGIGFVLDRLLETRLPYPGGGRKARCWSRS